MIYTYIFMHIYSCIYIYAYNNKPNKTNTY